jgi:hypothetical protein
MKLSGPSKHPTSPIFVMVQTVFLAAVLKFSLILCCSCDIEGHCNLVEQGFRALSKIVLRVRDGRILQKFRFVPGELLFVSACCLLSLDKIRLWIQYLPCNC